MTPSLSLALLLMCATGAATLLLFIWLSERVRDLYWLTACVHEQTHEAGEADGKRQSKLIAAVAREGQMTRKSVVEEGILTRYQEDEKHKRTRKKIDEITEEGGRIISYYTETHGKTEDHLGAISDALQQIKTRLSAEEKTNQAAKRKKRVKKHSQINEIVLTRQPKERRKKPAASK